MSQPEPESRPLTPVSDADHLQLSRLVTEAAWLVDLGQSDKLHELFVDDGTLNMGEAVYSGRDQIRQWGLDAIKAHTYDGIRHICGNMRFFSDSADSAEGVTVLTVFFDNRQDTLGTSVPWVVGEDHDQFIRTDHGWRIAQRNWETLFARPSPTA